jgi:hypothetical protein
VTAVHDTPSALWSTVQNGSPPSLLSPITVIADTAVAAPKSAFRRRVIVSAKWTPESE